MEAGFRGFGPTVFEWFAGLEADNSREYFAATRERYEEDVRGGLEALLDDLRGDFGDELKLFRQQRDLRFTPDKSPYKTTTYGILYDGRDGYYAQLSSAGLYAGTGGYMLAPDQLERMRAAIDDDRSGPALVRAVKGAEADGLEIEGETLKTAPRGYPRQHPRIELLRHRSLIAGRRKRPGRRGIPAAAAREHLARTWRAAQPINDWLSEHVGPSKAPLAERFGRGRRR
jgi:uncharacterized protein (TIGR02453 family)